MTIDELRHSIHVPRVDPASGGQPPARRAPVAGQPRFEDLLQKQISGTTEVVKFSAHAVDRLASRNITLTEKDMTDLTQAVDKVAEKGSKESLLMMRNLAFVVSVENRTVITAMDQMAGQERIFTNIDSAMII